MDNFVKITNFLTDISEDATAASRDMRKKVSENLLASTRVQVVGLIEPTSRLRLGQLPYWTECS